MTPSCDVHSVLLLPLFADPGRTAVAGVVEIVQASATMPFTNMVEVLSDAFKVGFVSSCWAGHRAEQISKSQV